MREWLIQIGVKAGYTHRRSPAARTFTDPGRRATLKAQKIVFSYSFSGPFLLLRLQFGFRTSLEHAWTRRVVKSSQIVYTLLVIIYRSFAAFWKIPEPNDVIIPALGKTVFDLLEAEECYPGGSLWAWWRDHPDPLARLDLVPKCVRAK